MKVIDLDRTHCYQTTSSNFLNYRNIFHHGSINKHRFPGIDTSDDEIMTEKILGIAEEVQNHINDT